MDDEYSRFIQWQKEREEKCYVKFLQEFRLTEEKLRKRIGERDFNMIKSFKNTYFFTHLYYEPFFAGGKGTKEDPIRVNLSEKEIIINQRPGLVFGVLKSFFGRKLR